MPTSSSSRAGPRCPAYRGRFTLNWLRDGAGSAILADLAAGRLTISHQALDAHPRRAAASYLRQMLVANGVLAERSEPLARLERWVSDTARSIIPAEHRRRINTYATWVVLRRLRRRADSGATIRIQHAKNNINAAVSLLDWLDGRDLQFGDLRQDHLDDWLAANPSGHQVRDFLNWAARRKLTASLEVPLRARQQGTALDDDARWNLIDQLLHDDKLYLTDRVAGCLLLLYGQPLSRIVAMTTDQIVLRGNQVDLRLGTDRLPLPEPVGQLAVRLKDTGRSYVGIGSPSQTPWLFPGLLPGRPLTAQRLAPIVHEDAGGPWQRL